MMGIEINEITTILAEDSINETDITCQLIVWFDILIVLLPGRIPSGKHNNNNKNNKKIFNIPSLFSQYKQFLCIRILTKH